MGVACGSVVSAVLLGAAKNRPITVTDVQSDGRPLAIPRDPRGALPVRDAVWLPSDLCADYQLRQRQWIDNNMSYLDGRALAVLQSGDSTFRRDTWSVYHNLHTYVPPRRVPPMALGPRCLWPFFPLPLPRPLSIAAPCVSTLGFPIRISSPPVPSQKPLRSFRTVTPP
eukprot:scaffold1148_cov108-Isochrysis_galbana.AAC.7